MALRLGAPVCQQHQCKCGERVDELGTHGLSCRYSAGRRSRHSSLNEVVKRALGSIGVPTVLEPRDLTRTDGKRPDGKSLIPWSISLASASEHIRICIQPERRGCCSRRRNEENYQVLASFNELQLHPDRSGNIWGLGKGHGRCFQWSREKNTLELWRTQNNGIFTPKN